MLDDSKHNINVKQLHCIIKHLILTFADKKKKNRQNPI